MPFATKQRLLLGLAVLMMLAPTFLYGAGKLGRAPVFDGDVRKEMTCLTCSGQGRDAKAESCPTCRGRGVAEFIVPGPHRPQQLIGTVKDAQGKVVKGAQISASEEGAESSQVVLETNDDGQFGIKLPPGNYKLSITTAASGSASEVLKVEPNSEPLPAIGYDTLHKLEKEFHLSK